MMWDFRSLWKFLHAYISIWEEKKHVSSTLMYVEWRTEASFVLMNQCRGEVQVSVVIRAAECMWISAG